ncbi:anhydro-N-acetylmuramic acid kinase [bacterium BMS3Bbin12]|nr:anhydro-N-acetylmuramic acid kinase [bacterium BMS3Abin12]GBE47373.1 anhydro-N-acetylmuramic acid kinase [bacterium BMS3Bbin12]GBE50321.1 anhydro-N-acetylmuramic acid kinase [bacterium BMS3Bbin13]HDJ85679.1 anhydro-N-acetylmuramic acid kinase [Chromatiales bacterium]
MPEYYIGLMSGTSMDAIDAALVDLEHAPALLATHRRVLPEDLRRDLRALAEGGIAQELECYGRLDATLGELFAEAARAVLREAGLGPDRVRAIGSHGQTVRHRPDGPHPFSLQIGDPNLIAERSGVTTVADFRRRDLAAGGQGAPLVPAFHDLVFRSPGEDRVVLNLGGIANVTCLPRTPDAPVTGFDTGPGNMLMDAWCMRHLGQPYDRDGAWAARGRVLETLLAAWLEEPFFARPPPKSTGREHFHLAWLEQTLTAIGSTPAAPEDVQATLCELTAASIARAVRQYAPATRRLLVCGGGAANRTLLERLRHRLPGCTVESTAAHGLDPQWVEAAAFAWLAQRTLAGAPGNLPAVTGARHPVILGAIYPACDDAPAAT